MKKISIFFILMFAIIILIRNNIAFSENIYSSLYGFSIDIPDDWSKRQPKKSWTLFTFAKLGSGENLNLNILNAEGLSSIKQIPLSQTFHPYYDHVIILQKEYENAQNTDFLHCIYKFKEGDLRKKIEGKYRLQYYVFQWIRNEKLFTLTFTDSEKNFMNNMQAFRKTVNSFKFGK